MTRGIGSLYCVVNPTRITDAPTLVTDDAEHVRERSELPRRGRAGNFEKSGYRNMMTPINISLFFYDPLKLEHQKAVAFL